ncbi:MAG: hypothetical protein M3R14_01350 [Acidobacteriota bacterium]|nr:hypothetical protein [Acidobacteriota bacterium]
MPVAEQQIVEKIKVLSAEEREEVLRYVEKVLSNRNRKQTLGEKIKEIVADVSDEVWEKIPSDGSEQHDHYIYGTPKK